MQLKECPFCGSDGIMQEDREDVTDVLYQVACKNTRCICYWHDFWESTEEEAVEAWNRRAYSGS